MKGAFAVLRATELLDHLAKEMHKTAKRPDSDAIHDVRVAIRRFRQCLDVFDGVFPSRGARKIDARLKNVLDAAGELRNLDIALELVSEMRLPHATGLIRDLRTDRGKSAKDFARIVAKLDDRNIAEKWRAKLAESAGTDPEKVAEATLPALVSDFFDAAEAAAASSKPKALHRFRIRTKKFRYTLELFAPLYGDTLKPRIGVLRTVQTHLGAINDCIATDRLLRRYGKHHEPVVTYAHKKLSQNASLRTKNFQRYSRVTFTDKQKTVWVAWLKRAEKP